MTKIYYSELGTEVNFSEQEYTNREVLRQDSISYVTDPWFYDYE